MICSVIRWRVALLLALIPSSASTVDWDDVAKIGIGAGVMACGTVLLWEGVTHAHFLYQKRQVQKLSSLTFELAKRYRFLFESGAVSEYDVARLFVRSVDNVDQLLYQLHDDYDALSYWREKGQRIYSAWLDEHNASVDVIGKQQIEWVLEDSKNLLSLLKEWDAYLNRYADYIRLYWHLECVALPLYDVYEKYPSVAYLKALRADLERISSLYQALARPLGFDLSAFNWDNLVQRYTYRVDFLRNEIRRVFESSSYQYEKEVMVREQREYERDLREREIEGALLRIEKKLLDQEDCYYC